MKKTKTILIFTLSLILVASITHAAILTKYVSITGQVTVLPFEEPEVPPNKDACMQNGWRDYVKLSGIGFSNQGDCISYLQTYMCEDWEILNDMYPELNVSGPSAFGQCVSYFSKAKNEEEKDKPGRGRNNTDEEIEELDLNMNETEENITIEYNLTIELDNTTEKNETNNITQNQTNETITFEEKEEMQTEEGDENQ